MPMTWLDDTQACKPVVSVVIPCYGQAHFLPDAIESVVAQSYSPTELIVIDDGSPDNVGTVVERYAGVRCFTQENRGVAAARNTGIEQEAGPHIVLLDADARLIPDALS